MPSDRDPVQDTSTPPEGTDTREALPWTDDAIAKAVDDTLGFRSENAIDRFRACLRTLLAAPSPTGDREREALARDAALALASLRGQLTMLADEVKGDRLRARVGIALDALGAYEQAHKPCPSPTGGEGDDARWTHAVQRDVADFHEALDCPIGDTPAIRRPGLRADLIREEAAETVDAIERGDLVKAIDGMCDVLAVVYGTALEFGVDLAPFWEEVHRTNMAKRGGPVREDGKRLKPPGWTPPDIAGVLARVGGGADVR